MSEIKELNRKLFDQYPVLAWADDEDGYVPVAEHSPLPLDRGPLLIKARLLPSNGPALDGYVIGLGSVYALGIFAGDTDFVFNRQMGAECGKVASGLFATLGIQPLDIFPLRFTTEFHFANGETIGGSFTVDS